MTPYEKYQIDGDRRAGSSYEGGAVDQDQYGEKTNYSYDRYTDSHKQFNG